MGREIRRVPPDWEHPCYEQGDRYAGQYHPCYDQDYASAAAEWIDNLALWQKGEHPDQKDGRYPAECRYYWEWAGAPPDEEYNRQRAWPAEEATAYQVYETVSAGTPVSPVFPTVDALSAWLLEQGHSVKAADAFIDGGLAPSMIVGGGHGIRMNIDALDDL